MSNIQEKRQFYENVFDVLHDLGGAPERLRENFVTVHLGQPYLLDEYRFQGELGFGGKYWHKTNRVSCYSEDETPGRLALIDRLNSELAVIG